MRRLPTIRAPFVLAVVAGAMALGAAAPNAAAQNPRVAIETDAGRIVVELYADKAPITAANFLRYVQEGRYDGGAFYRVVTMQNQPTSPVKIEVIQGGLDADSARRLPPIAHETNDKTGIKHLDGTISMARSTPGSASSEFFFCIGDQPELDFGGKRNPDGQGFAAFGRVTQGMDVVRRIQQGAADDAPPQRLKTVIKIRSVKRL
ncbi:MAG TPA: peptidylprolyl isomerase [Gemmatimonadaceae bacterium]|nr:peptidylprolyl isomerase [Gemmatimonadaceae bacterium]